MKKLLSFTLIAFMVIQLKAATGEVTRSGSTWTARIDGSTVYTGSNMTDAINACCYNMGSGTINVRNSGDSGPTSGSVKACFIQSNQTLDFHNNTYNGSGTEGLNVAVRANGKSNVTVRNLKTTGKLRYGIWLTNCTNMYISNIVMDNDQQNSAVGLGIRVADGSNLNISGNINLKTRGHSLETYTVNGIFVGTVTVESLQGCGVLFNDSENCNIDAIYAYNCNTGGSYAGFRQANDNSTTHCGFLYARNCGRGLYTLSGSHDVTVDEVDIADCTTSGISPAGSSYNVRVNSGTVSNTPKAIDIWNGATNICIKVNGGSYGDACGSSSGSYYNIVNRNSGKYVDVSGVSSSDNADIVQWSSTGGYNQQWQLVDAGSGYLYIKVRHSGKCMRAVNGNIVQYTCYDGYWSEMFTRQDVGSGYYLLKNRNTGTCLKVANGSSSDGASIILESCNTGYWSQQFSFGEVRSAYRSEVPLSVKDVNIYPTLVDDILNINLSGQLNNSSDLHLYNSTGKLVLSKKLHDSDNTVDLTNMSPGIYFVNVSGNNEVTNQKIIKK